MDVQTKTIKGILRSVQFSSWDGLWSVAVVEEEDSGREMKVTGNLFAVRPGDLVAAHGQWQSTRFGPQFRIDHLTVNDPVSEEGLISYLSSDYVEGIGPVLAERIVETFGTGTLAVIDETPERLSEGPGIGPQRAATITAAWESQRAERRTLLFLQENNIGPSYAKRILQEYGRETIDVVRANPYRLARDIRGIGFKIADRIAGELGIQPASQQRIEAGLIYSLGMAQNEGHLGLPRLELTERSGQLLQVDPDLIETALDNLLANGELVNVEAENAFESELIYHRGVYRMEREVADLLRERIARPQQKQALTDRQLHAACAGDRLRLTATQERAVLMAARRPLSIITGGPGTGKTTIIHALCRLCERMGSRLLLGAPTGRAAKRLSEATRREAATLHRLLEYRFAAGGFQRDAANLLDADVLIVDEASMIDIYLARALLRALPPQASVVLVGDADQLPPVGIGNLLKDMIASERIPVARLTDIFRQAHESRIITNAHRILSGYLPETASARGGPLSDFYHVEANAESGPKLLLRMLKERIPRRFGLDPVRDVQVISPQRAGSMGVTALNQLLQGELNPETNPLTSYRGRLRVNDKVIQQRNNYDLEVFNGDIGFVEAISPSDRQVQVRFDNRLVTYQPGEVEDLELAYAITVHKSQGSEYPAVVFPLMKQHFISLQRNLLYTGLTRAQRLAVIMGERYALQRAVENDAPARRYTSLRAWLSEVPSSVN